LTVLAAAALLLAVQPAHAQGSASTTEAQEPDRPSQQQAYLQRLRPEDGWRVIEGGVRMRWLAQSGSGLKPKISDQILIHYEGRLIDGTMLDSSYARSYPDAYFLNRTIKGWQIAIPQMSVGDKVELAIPSNLAYGLAGPKPIPRDATLVFKMELLEILN
jgi:FKBP-type peptidyl-prolyl cis-trans isomerase